VLPLRKSCGTGTLAGALSLQHPYAVSGLYQGTTSVVPFSDVIMAGFNDGGVEGCISM